MKGLFRNGVGLCCFAVTGVALVAQQLSTIRTTVPLVVAPVTVTDKQGKHVFGLKASDFELIDRGKTAKIDVELSTTPVSLVFVVGANQNARAALAKLQKVGSMVEPLLMGAGGEAAVIRYGSEVKVVRDFTRDGREITNTFRGFDGYGQKARLIDGVQRAIGLLGTRQAERRRIIIPIGEAKDRGSEAKLPEVLESAQIHNVVIFPLRYSAMLTAFTARGDAGTQGRGAPDDQGLIGIFREMGRLGAKDTMEAMAKFSGGQQYSFVKQSGLESVFARLGEEIHSQYLVSFQPLPAEQPEFRKIEVRLPGHPEWQVRAQTGYWMR